MKNNIYHKIFQLRKEIGTISKDASNPFYRSKYFDINSLIGQLKPLLQKHNLVLIQPITDNQVRSVIVDLDGGSVESSIQLPNDLDEKKLTSLKKLGINRLSIGIQSFDDADLKFMNRSSTGGIILSFALLFTLSYVLTFLSLKSSA